MTVIEQNRDLLSGLVVLVVDDEPDIVGLLLRQLKAAGARAVGAGDATEALGLLDRLSFDCMVCDISMPDVSGIDLPRRIRARQAKGERRLPVIAFTGAVDDDTTDALAAAGFQACLLKPADLTAMVSTVQRVLH